MQALAAELVANAGIGADDVVLDFGAGSGRLTAELARVARRVVAIELDPRLAAELRDRWDNVEVVEADAAGIRLPREPFRVVSNVPFGRTTDLLHLLLDDADTPLVQADVVVEWAVAHKHGVPWPSSLNGVLWGAIYEARVSRRLSRGAFAPPPSVDAGLLVFRRRLEPLVPPSLAAAYHRFVANGFRRGLRSVVTARELRGIGADRMTARDLDAHQWSTLFVRSSQPHPGSTTRRRRW